MAPIGETHGFEHGLRPFPGGSQPRELCHESDILQRRKRGHEMEKLKDKAQVLASKGGPDPFLRGAEDHRSRALGLPGDRALLGRQQTTEAVKQGALAATTASGQGEGRPGGQGQGKSR